MDFELRRLKADDMFPMFQILSKIGFKDFKESMSPEKIKEITSSMKGEVDAQAVGISIVFEVVEIIMKNLPSCKKEIYTFLSNLSGLKEQEISELDISTFTELIISVVQKEEFKDFFKVVSRLFK